MKSLLYYLIQVTAASGILYGYYHFVLRNKKFHHYNRFYLLAAVLISMLIPFLNIPIYFSEKDGPSVVFQTLNAISSDDVYVDINNPAPAGLTIHAKTNWLTWQNLSWCFYVLVSSLALIKIAFSLKRIRLIIRRNVVEQLDNIHFVNTDEPGTPFSFFRWLFWNRNIELSSEKGEQVFRHELFHIRQKHSWDIVFMELITVVFWINPFYHLLKKELKAIHEFVADEFATKVNEKWKYAELLLMQALNTQNHLLNPFFNNQIKRRIAMITSSTKPSYQYLRKVMVLPIAVIVVTLFAFSYKQIAKEKVNVNSNIIQDTIKPKQDKILFEVTSPGPKPFSKAIPTAEQLASWQDPKTYGVWIDSKRIDNAQLKNYKPSDFSHYFISKLAKTAINYGKHVYQLDLMTNKFYNDYLKSWDPNKKFTITRIVDGDTIPRVVKKYNDALILFNGQEIDAKTLDSIDPGSIKWIKVLKGDTAKAKYGDKGKNGVIEIFTKDQKTEYDDKINPDPKEVWTKVEVEASFPGGDKAWAKFLVKNLDAGILMRNKAPNGKYTVWIKFIVDKEGGLSDFKALTNHGFGMEDEALRVIKQSPKWQPALQNGKKVTAYRLQPITFVLAPVNGNVNSNEVPRDEGKKLNEVVVSTDNTEDYVWTKTEVPPSFPGGEPAFNEFLSNFLSPWVPVNNGAAKGTYTVWIQLIVDKEGNPANWKALTQFGHGMEEEALRVIKKVEKWVPAVQNGHNVTAYKKQPITFIVAKDPVPKTTSAGFKMSKEEIENATPFYLLKLKPGEEVVSFTMIFDAVGMKEHPQFDLTGNDFSDEVKTIIRNIQTKTWIYLENITVKTSNKIEKRPPMYGAVIPDGTNKSNNSSTDNNGKVSQIFTDNHLPNFNDPEFKRKWHEMISEVKAIAWKEGKAAYEYKGRTYVFGKIKNPDPSIAAFTEQNGTGHVFLLNGELITSIDELNKLITRNDVKKFGFISQEEALKRFNRNDAIVFVETYDSYITKK